MNLLRLNKSNEFIYILSKIRETYPTAIIAGGALRDLYHNKPIHDIDIFVPLDDSDEDFWEEAFALKDTDYIENLNADDSYTDNNHIGNVWEICKNDTLYNIILTDVKPKDYVMKHFDIGLCKIYCDGNRIHLSADFMSDSRFKTLTVVSKNMPQREFDHMMNYHIKKLKHKYPEYALVVPPEYDDLLNKYNRGKT